MRGVRAKSGRGSSMSITQWFAERLSNRRRRRMKKQFRQGVEKLGRRVRSGPFEGMQYIDRAVGSAHLPKVLGIYELELHDVIEEICSMPLNAAVDVGAAEGYYACGLLYRNPAMKVIAFETTEDGRSLMRQLAAANGLESRLAIRGHCDLASFDQALRELDHPLVIMDIEGGEQEILDPEKLPQLKQACILVELHEFIIEGIEDEIRRRFETSHDIVTIETQERTLESYPPLPKIKGLEPRPELAKYITEGRPAPMKWYWMKPRQPADV